MHMCVHECVMSWYRGANRKLAPLSHDIFDTHCWPEVWFDPSLIPRPTLFFCSSVCVGTNTQKQKSSEKRGWPGIIYIMNDIRWT